MKERGILSILTSVILTGFLSTATAGPCVKTMAAKNGRHKGYHQQLSKGRDANCHAARFDSYSRAGRQHALSDQAIQQYQKLHYRIDNITSQMGGGTAGPYSAMMPMKTTNN